MKKHNFLTRVVSKAGKEAGLNVKVEPDTFGLLLGEFSKSDCKRVFPKHASKSYREKFEAVITYQDKELKHLCARQIAAHVSDVFLGPDPIKLDPSPLLVERTNAKISKYSRLVHVGKKQFGEKKRKQAPKFTNNFVLNASWLERAPMASLLWTLYEISAASSSQTCSLLWLQVVGK
jgi:hypothetical protein